MRGALLAVAILAVRGQERQESEERRESADFGASAGLAGVEELCRLMVELETPRLWVLTAAVLRGLTGKDFGGVTMQTPPDIREGIAGRYRAFVDAERAAGGR